MQRPACAGRAALLAGVGRLTYLPGPGALGGQLSNVSLCLSLSLSLPSSFSDSP